MTKKLKSVAYLLIGIFTFQTSFLSIGSAQEFMLPGDVENLQAVAKDSSVKLTWDKATDADGVILGYKIYYGTNSVKTIDDEYADEILTNSSELSYEVSNLINGVQYYFSVTAIDDEENESENYSIEVSAMPFSSTAENPSVISAEQKSFTEIEVVMSKEVTVKSLTNSFAIKEKLNPANYIDIETTKLNGEKVTLVINANALNPSTNYIVTATSTVEDYFGNPVSSGITDSVEFVSKSTEVLEEIAQKEAEAANEEPQTETPAPEDTNSPFEEEIVIFNPEGTNNEFTPETEPPFDPATEPPFTPETETPFAPETEFDPATPENETNDPIQQADVFAPENSETGNEHNAAPAQDTTPPLGAQAMQLDQSSFENEGYVTINWTPAPDVEKDIIDQIVYTREEGGEWDEGYSVGKNTNSIELEVEKDKNYEIKIVTLDMASNKTESEALNFSTKLIQSGSGTVVSFFLAFILSGFYFIYRRRVC